MIEILDSGKGIENIEIAKQPLYTTKSNMERSGMGFTIMESFMDHIEVESMLGIGTKVTMSKVIKSKEDSKSSENFEYSENFTDMADITNTTANATISGDE